MTAIRVAHVIFPRPSLLRPLPEFAWDAARALDGCDAIDVEMLLPVPLTAMRKLQDISRSAHGARIWPDGLDRALANLEPRPTLIPYLPVPRRSIESAATALATALILRPRALRPRVLHGSFLDEGGFVAATAARILGCPSVAVAHGSDTRAAGGLDDDSRGRQRRALAALRHASAVVAVSHSLADRVARLGRRAEVIPFTTPESRFPLVPPPNGTPKLLFVGRIEHAKGVDLLLDALARTKHTSARLELVGPSSKDVDVAALAGHFGVADRVTVTAEVPHDELAAVYARNHCLVLPSRAEGLGNVLVESLLVGRPVIATDVGAPAEVVDDRVGRLVPAEDPAALAAAIDTVLDAQWSPEQLRGHAIPWTWTAMTPRIEALVWRLIHESAQQ